jgi:hypothetical protein
VRNSRRWIKLSGDFQPDKLDRKVSRWMLGRRVSVFAVYILVALIYVCSIAKETFAYFSRGWIETQ